MATNDQVIAKLSELEDTFRQFVEQYDADMRGDMGVNGAGKPGIVNTIREIKKYQLEYPSLTWLFAKQPFKVAAVVLGVYIVLMTLWTAGVIKIFADIFGL